MIFQEPMTALDPVYTIGTQIAETVLRHKGGSRASRPRARAGTAGAGEDPRPPSAGSTTIRTNCPAGCASAR